MQRGQVLGLLGPNGAGKTTTLSMLTGLIQPSHGQIFISGIPASTNNQLLEGFCPQHTALWPLATVEEHLVLLGRLRGLTLVS